MYVAFSPVFSAFNKKDLGTMLFILKREGDLPRLCTLKLIIKGALQPLYRLIILSLL